MNVPNIGPAQILLCKLGWHHRDPGTRRRDGYDVVAACSGCGQPMVHEWNGWQIDPHGRRADEATD